MQVRAQPSVFSPVIGKVVAGEQFSISERDFTGSWWRISYDGQPGWVSDHLVAANIRNAPVAVPVAMIERRVNVRSGPGASNPVIGVAIPGQQYLITGKSAAGDWWQIDDGGRPGWVFGELVTAVDAGGVQVAVVKFPAPPLLPVTVAVMTVNRGMNVPRRPRHQLPRHRRGRTWASVSDHGQECGGRLVADRRQRPARVGLWGVGYTGQCGERAGGGKVPASTAAAGHGSGGGVQPPYERVWRSRRPLSCHRHDRAWVSVSDYRPECGGKLVADRQSRPAWLGLRAIREHSGGGGGWEVGSW